MSSHVLQFPALHGFTADSFRHAAEFGRRMETLVDEIHAAPRADGVERIYVPGEMEWECHESAMKDGIALPEDVVASLEKAAQLVEVALPEFTR